MFSYGAEFVTWITRFHLQFKAGLSSWHDLLVEPLATDAGFATVLSPDATFQQVFAAAAASQQVAADDPAAQRRKISIKF